MYLVHNGRWWQWICEFYTANFKLKYLFWDPWSECAWQQAITCCLSYRSRMFQNAFFPWNRNLLVSQKWCKDTFFPTLHLFSLVIFATATVVAFVLLRNSRFNFQCYTQREATPTQKSAQKCCCDLLRLLARKITKGIHSCKHASLNRPIRLLLLRSCSLLIAWIFFIDFFIIFISMIYYIYNVSLSLVIFSQGVYNFCLNLSLMWWLTWHFRVQNSHAFYSLTLSWLTMHYQP